LKKPNVRIASVTFPNGIRNQDMRQQHRILYTEDGGADEEDNGRVMY